jgi:IclR family transcriptional regulator, acetate operon repressor
MLLEAIDKALPGPAALTRGDAQDLAGVAGPTGAAGADDAHEPVQSSASKTLALLESLARVQSRSFGVTEVAHEIGLPKSTTHRLLKTLEEHGFVARNGSRYRVGGRFFELSEAARWSEHGELRDVAYRPLAWLFERSDAIAVHLAILRGRDVVYLDKITRPEGTRLPSRIGGSFPATCTALGKAILAFSDRAAVEEVLGQPLARATPYSIAARRQLIEQLNLTRSTGFAVEREEASHGTICVAAPIFRDGKAIAALSVCVASLRVARSTGDSTALNGKLATEAAAAVARLLPAN